ncbi:hypothetical protein H0H92_007282 [Tricholoma furcatifolium]|nr:hypothetical protein H0H92_007282 [Tricholoma furcatifolium]
MPRENSLSDSDGRSLTPDLDEEFDGPVSPISTTSNARPPTNSIPPITAPSRGLSTSLRSPSKRSILSKTRHTPATQKSHQWPTSENVIAPIDRFRAVVRKVMVMHRGTSYLTGNVGRVGAEPGVNPRRASANLLYGHIKQDCVIEVIDYSSVRSSFGRMTNAEFINLLEDPRASEKEPWAKVRWINIGGLSWDVVKAVSIKYDLHPLALEDVFHTRSSTRSKADYYTKHLFLRVLCHQLGAGDEYTGHTESAAFGSTLNGVSRSHSPEPVEKYGEEGLNGEEDEGTMYDSTTMKKRRSILPFLRAPPQDLEGAMPSRLSSNSSLGKLMNRATAKRQSQERDDVTLTTLKDDDRDRVKVKVSPMFIFLLRDGTVISIHTTPTLQLTSAISTRLHQRDTVLRTSADPSLLVHAILDLIVDNALEVVNEYHDKITKFESAVLLKTRAETVKHLHILSGDLILHKRTLEPIRTMIYSLRRYDLDRCQALIDMSNPENANVKVVGFMSHRSKIYLADVLDHMEHILTNLDMFAGIAENLISYTFNLASYEMNQVMRRLTLITIICLPLSLFTGYFGMNFVNMWSIHNHSDLFFWEIALPIMAVIIPTFFWSDISDARDYVKKKINTKKAVEVRSRLPTILYDIAFNTEIVNFHVPEVYNEEISFTKNWPKLSFSDNEREWTMPPAPLGTPITEICASQSTTNYTCPHELWLALDLARDWSTYSSFTLRLSYPASYPAEFSLDIFDPKSLSAHFKLQSEREHHPQGSYSSSSATQARLRYARIRLVDTGVLTPRPKTHVTSTEKITPTPVPFILILEPLYFGVLPPIVVPALGYIVCVCLLAWMIVPTLIRRIETIAAEAKREFSINKKHE